MNKELPRICTPKDTYTFDYPWAIERADEQNSVFWTHDEIDLSKDIQDIYTELTEWERHGVLTVLKLFVKYELKVNDYWSGVVAKKFPRPDIQRMAYSFAFFETNVHASFYNKINELLSLNTDEFYDSYLEDPVLASRMSFIDECLNHPNPLFSTAVFSCVEGAVLYSSFGFLKHFQSLGKNKLKNLVAGINFSTRDEHIHSIAGAELHNTLKLESELTQDELDELQALVKEAVLKIREHEHQIIDKVFEKGHDNTINPQMMKTFVDSRLNICLNNIGMPDLFVVQDNPVADWFYLGISSAKIHDFFAKMGNQYHRVWDEEEFRSSY
jgi:ribonucleoside-diphosphate reductase beta chain